MAELTLACASYPFGYLSRRVFSDIFVPHSVPVTLGTPDDDLPSREFIVADVRVPFKYELTVLSDRFLTSGNPSGSIAARMQTLRPRTVAKAWYSQ
jgi:hypothetical protein